MASIDDSSTELTGDEAHDLETFKNWIRDAEEYWNSNVQRFMYYMNFLCVTTVDQGDETLLEDMSRPSMMFNQLDAIGCKLMGEFASQEPGIVVAASDGVIVDDEIATTVECIEAHMRHDLAHANNGNASNRVFKDNVYGGYGAMEVYTEYLPKSLKQCIKHQRLNPTMVGWDPMATEPHKGDGKFCYKKTYMTYDSIKLKWGKELADSISYTAGSSTASTQAFSWSYQNTKQKVAVIVEMYVKRERMGKWVQLSNDEEMDEKEYKKLLKEWEKVNITLPPPIIQDSRDEVFTDIIRYTLCESQFIGKPEETIYEMLPIVFFDGNSAEVQLEKGGCVQQFTRSYFHNARDAQKFKDFAGQTFAGELQSTMQSKIIAADEGIPEQYLENYLNPQHNSVLIYKPWYKDNPEHPIPPPEVIQRPDIPQSIPAAFYGADKLIQTTLGSYDTELAMQPRISGAAIEEGSMQSDAASKPYFDNFFEGLNRVAQIRLNLIPKVYKTPRSIPITLKNGKKSYAIVNSENFKPRTTDPQERDVVQNKAVYMNYSPSDLLVQVKSGPNSAVQKRNAVDQITKLMNVSPELNALFSGPGVEILIDNLDFRGSERLKSIIGPFQKEQQQKAQQASKMQMQMQDMQAQLQKMQGSLFEAQANKYNAEAAAVQPKLQLENKKVDNKESIDVATMILDKQKEDDKKEIDTGKLFIEEQKAVTATLLSRQQLASDQVDQVLRGAEIDSDNAHRYNEHLLDIDKHEHEKSMSEKALENEKASAVSAVKGD